MVHIKPQEKQLPPPLPSPARTLLGRVKFLRPGPLQRPVPPAAATPGPRPYLVRGHFADGVPGLQGLQLIQAPVQLLHGLASQFLVGLLCEKTGKGALSQQASRRAPGERQRAHAPRAGARTRALLPHAAASGSGSAPPPGRGDTGAARPRNRGAAGLAPRPGCPGPPPPAAPPS